VKKLVLRRQDPNESKPTPVRSGGRFAERYLADLNDQQRQAVLHNSGPALVLAGAGTGKTRTLIYRLARLVDDGVPAGAILLLTFTRKAAAEMISRASALGEPRCAAVAGGTFHSFAWNIIQRHKGQLGYGTESITILDTSDAEDVIQIVRTDANVKRHATGRFPQKGVLQRILSASINRAMPVADIVHRHHPQQIANVNIIIDVLERYRSYKRRHNLLDYDDLLLVLLEALRSPSLGPVLTSAYQHVMVDEYQDTNALQHAIVKALVPHGNIMVVGDDAQSIYAFRGADVQNIHAFPHTFSDCTIIRLERNYRSTQPILDFCNDVVRPSTELFPKELTSSIAEGDLPMLVQCVDEAQQSAFVAQLLLEHHEQGMPLAHMAVLFRSSFQSFDLEIELGRKGIPFRKIGGLRFAEAAHVKDLLALLRITVNTRDAVAWNRILLLIDGVGTAQAAALVSHITNTIDGWQGASDAVRKGPRDAVQALINAIVAARHIEAATDRLRALAEWYRPVLQRKYEDATRRWRDVDAVVGMAASHGNASAFLADIALDPPNATVDDIQASPDDDDVLTLSTIHSAKGLEWKTVVVLGVNDGRLPSARSVESSSALEEERRLLYVACTRAKQHLALTYLATIQTWEHGAAIGDCSRFILDVQEDHFDRYALVEEKVPDPNTKPLLAASAAHVIKS